MDILASFIMKCHPEWEVSLKHPKDHKAKMLTILTLQDSVPMWDNTTHPGDRVLLIGRFVTYVDANKFE